MSDAHKTTQKLLVIKLVLVGVVFFLAGCEFADWSHGMVDSFWGTHWLKAVFAITFAIIGSGNLRKIYHGR